MKYEKPEMKEIAHITYLGCACGLLVGWGS